MSTLGEIWEMQRTIRQAKEVINNADNVAGELADILPGRLRHCSGYTLQKLKRELKDFDSRTCTWKDK